MVSTIHKAWTDEELLALPDGQRYELVDGELIMMSPSGARHGNVVAELLMRIRAFVRERRLGHVFDGQTGFRLPGGNLRSPDVSFVKAERLAGGLPSGFLHLAPDLAVEVLSPTDRAGEVAQKVAEYLSADVKLLWVIDSDTRSAVVYRPGATPHRPLGDILEGEDVLPGFTCPLASLFD
ncbi:MAG TPA: Uma2 family endonuclease [Vicinamibacteria bacterium]